MAWMRFRKKDLPGGLWVKCPGCKEMLFGKELDENCKVCKKCAHHFSLTVEERVRFTLDENSFVEIDANMETVDALEFVDSGSYADKLAKNEKKTGRKEAMVYGTGRLRGRELVFGALEFGFMGGSMGVVVGEKVTRAAELALDLGVPLLLFSASGGARMHEGALSLMQMAKTCAALQRLGSAGGLFISVMAHPTTGGVTASWATMGDILLSEPKALIGFAGPRVIQTTIRQELPEGFQTAEFLLEHGQLDRIVPRPELVGILEQLFCYCLGPIERGTDDVQDPPLETDRQTGEPPNSAQDPLPTLTLVEREAPKLRKSRARTGSQKDEPPKEERQRADQATAAPEAIAKTAEAPLGRAAAAGRSKGRSKERGSP